MSTPSSISRPPKLSPVDRARRYIEKCEPAVSGAGGHSATYAVACVLVQGFALSEPEALSVMQEFNARCTPPWSEHELRHKLRSANAEPGLQQHGAILPRGCFLKGRERSMSLREQLERNKQVRDTPEDKARREEEKKARAAKLAFNREALTAAAASWTEKANLLFLANRSAQDPALVTREGFLKAMYSRPGDKVIVQAEYGKDVLWPDEGPLPEGGRDGVKYYANPVHGRYVPNPRGRIPKGMTEPPPSRKIKECVESFRFLVLESDKADMKDWLGFLVQAPLRIASICTSGGRSIHTLVRVDCRSAIEYAELKAKMAPFLAGVQTLGVDTGPMNVLAPTRLPQCWRAGKVVMPPQGAPAPKPGEKKPAWGFFPFPKGPKLQKLLFLNPEPDGRPIIDLPEIRDVEKHWCDQASRIVDGYDPLDVTHDQVGEALRYYRNVSAACREALGDLKP